MCTDEALSGTTTINAGSHTIDVSYDGQTDCDTTHTVRWTFDGADQGELAGSSCSAGGGSSGALVFSRWSGSCAGAQAVLGAAPLPRIATYRGRSTRMSTPSLRFLCASETIK